MKWPEEFFHQQDFMPSELVRYQRAAQRDLDIAKKTGEPEVTFHFTYMALVKIGIYCIAKEGYRIKSRPGHHQKIIERLSQLLNDEDILVLGDKMRKERNLDFYNAATFTLTDEIHQYLQFVKTLFKKVIKL